MFDKRETKRARERERATICLAINLSVFYVSMQKVIDFFEEPGSNSICMIRIKTIALEALMHMGVALSVTLL